MVANRKQFETHLAGIMLMEDGENLEKMKTKDSGETSYGPCSATETLPNRIQITVKPLP